MSERVCCCAKWGLAGLLLISILFNIILLYNFSSKKNVPKKALPASFDVPEEDSVTQEQKQQPLLCTKGKYNKWNSGFAFTFNDQPDKNTVRYSIHPSVQNASHYCCNQTLYIEGDFVPGQIYTVTVHKGLKSFDGKALEEDVKAMDRIPEKDRQISFITKGPYLALHGKRTLGMSFCNVSKVRYTLWKFYENNLSFENLDSYSARKKLQKIASWEEPLHFPANRECAKNLQLDHLLPGKTPGVYLIEAEESERDNSYYYSSDSCVLVLTDLAVLASVDKKSRQAAVAIRKISDRTPVANAVITLFSIKNQPVGKGVSGPDGTAVIAFDKTFDDTDDSLRSLIVRSGKDMTFFEFDDITKTGSVPDAAENGSLLDSAPKAFVYTARGIYRPGEKVDVSMFVRNYAEGIMKVTSNIPCRFSLLDPDQREVAFFSTRTDKNGYAEHAFELSKNAVAGVYTIRCGINGSVWGETKVLAGAFMPDRIQVKVTPLFEGPVNMNRNLEFRLDGKYYFGAEVLEGIWRGKLRSSLAPVPEHWKGWTVGAEEDFKPMNLSVKTVTENGVRKIRYEGNHKPSFAPVLLTAVGEVSEPGSRYVAGHTSAVLLPTESFIGLRQNGKNGTGAVFDYAILSYRKGQKLPEEKDSFRITLARRKWEFVYNAGTGRRDWNEVIEACPEFTQTLAGKTSGEFRFRNLPAGNYLVTVEDASGQRKSVLEFWHEAGKGSERSANPNALDIALDRALYKHGKKVRLSFKVPADGMVFAVYGDNRIRRTIQQKVTAGENTLETVIPYTVPGDVYFAGITFEGGSDGKLFHSFGAVRIPVDCESYRMDVTLSVPEEARPGSRVPLKIRLQDTEGKPCTGIVQVMVCDEGILSLTGFKTPDIFQYFWKSLNSGMTFYDMFGLIFPELVIGEDGHVAGDGVARRTWNTGKELFTHLKSVCSALKPVQVPASGEVQIPFTVPEHQGALRVMAVASGDLRAGSASCRMTVRDTAGLLLRLPRAAAPGDAFESVCSVFNHGKKDAGYTLEITLPAGWKTAGKTRFEGVLKAGSSCNITLPLQIPADAAGLQKVTARLTLGDFAGNFTEKIVLRQPQQPSVKSGIITVAPGESMTYEVKKEEWKGKTETVFSIFGTPLNGVELALNYLNDYPYGCLEQTVAAAFPMLAAPELAKLGLISGGMAKTAGKKVEAAYSRILPMMQQNGGFSMWPGGRSVWQEGTVFAAHFLYTAKDAGMISVDKSVEKKLKKYLERSLQDADMKPVIRAYTAYVLACSGNNDAAQLEAKRVLLKEKGNTAAFLAGAALVRLGYASEGRSAMIQALKAKCFLAGSLGNIGSEASLCGMLLTVLMTEDPDAGQGAELALHLQQLLREDASGWGVTQSNAWAVMGLAKFAAVNPAAPVKAAVKIGNGQEITPDPAVLRSVTIGEEKLTVRNDGKAPIFVRTGTSGIAAKPVSGGTIRLRRELLDMAGNPVKEIRHGDQVQVRLTVTAPKAVENLVICDLLPGGFEIEDPRLATRSATPETVDPGKFRNRRMERLDDRFLLFGNMLSTDFTFTYTVRAVTRGTWYSPELRAEAMYDAELQGVFAETVPVVIR